MQHCWIHRELPSKFQLRVTQNYYPVSKKRNASTNIALDVCLSQHHIQNTCLVTHRHSSLNILLSQNIYHFWYIIICKTGIRILLGKAQPYVKSEQGSLPLMSFYLFGCWNNYRLEKRRTGSENGHIPRCSRHLFPWISMQEKKENQEIQPKISS